MNLQDGTVIVTGAGSGIGRALAAACASEGAHVVCCGRRPEPLEETVAFIRADDRSAECIPVDITAYDQVESAVKRVLESRGQVDVLLNNAGLFSSVGPLWEVDPERWARDAITNLIGTMHGCRAVLPSMIQRDSGLIVNTSGGGANAPLAGGSGYGSSKAAVLRLTDTLALELKRKMSNVGVVAIDPGFNETAMTRSLAEADNVDEWMPHVNRTIGSGDMNTPEQVARSVVDLVKSVRPEFFGKVFRVPFDMDALNSEAQALADGDRLTLRFKQ